MTTPEEEYNKQQDTNNDENKKSLSDKVQHEPFELPSFMSGCFGFGFINILLLITMGLLSINNTSILDIMPYYVPMIIIFIINFFFIRYFFKTGRKSYAYGVILESIFILLITKTCFT